METVKDFKDAGLAFVEGDMVHSTSGCETSKGESLMDCATRVSLIDSFISIGDKFACGVWTIESFAWRTNTGVKPEFDGEIDVELSNGQASTVLAAKLSDLDWLVDDISPTLVKWRPHLPKVEDKPKSPYDVDAHVSGEDFASTLKRPFESKPVFTQAMADAGELPPVGSECLVKSGSLKEWFSGICVGSHDDFSVFKMEESYPFNSVYAGFQAGRIKPLPTEREKAIEYAFNKMFPGDVSIGDAKQVLGIAFDAGLLQTPKNNVT